MERDVSSPLLSTEEYIGAAHWWVMLETRHGAPPLQMPRESMSVTKAIGATVPQHATMTQVRIIFFFTKIDSDRA